MEKQNLPDDLPKRYSDWCHRRPLVCADHDQYKRATIFFTRRDLSPSERAAFYFHELTGCEGFEFVAFSNARLKGPVKLANSIVLVPCFLDTIEGCNAKNQLVQLTNQMEQKSRFIYDGWISINLWEEKNVRIAINSIDEALSTFCIEGRIFFDWEPKYLTPNDRHSTYILEDEHIQEFESIARILDSLEENDRIAIYRSLAWLSQGIRLDEPAARFLFSILAIESLAIYIEETASENSPLIKLRTKTMTDTERNKCIKDTLTKWLDDDPRKAIETAYFDCVIPTTQRLKGHLRNAFASNAESYDLLFKHKVEKKTLYDLRHYVAHGRVNALSELEREQIRQRVWDAERIARQYIWVVFEEALNTRHITDTMKASVFFGALQMVVSNEGMYRGPTHMAVLYYQ